MKSSHKTRFLVQMAVLAAMSVLLVYLIHFPIFPAAPFLEYDPADIPILIGTFMFGPVGGLIITAVACVATGSFVLVAGNIYKKNRTRKGAVIALVAGALTMTITMVLWNIVMTPIFMGTPREAVLAMILPVILPFNLIKAGANAVITFFVYKSVSKVLGMEIQEKSKVAKTEA